MNTLREVHRIARSLEGQGATIRSTKKGYQVRFKDGSTLTLHFTLSDHRALRNARAAVLRAGLIWPGDARSTR